MQKRIFPLIVSFLFVYNNIFAQENIDELLNMTLEDLLKIEIVSASKKAESSFEAPLSSNVITNEDIKKAGCTSVMEALRLLPEIIVREQTPGNYDIHLRGFDNIDPNGVITTTANTMTLVMVNNRVVYNDFQGGTFWELLQINVNDIERIEVVRGPVAAMYGPNAVTGVINIFTKSALTRKDGFYLSSYSMGGNNTTGIANATLGYQFNQNLAIKITGTYDRRNRGNIDYYILSNKKAINFNPNGTPKAPYQTVTWVDKLDSTLLNINNSIVKDPNKPRTYPSNIFERYPDFKKATDRYNYLSEVAFKNDDLAVTFNYGFSKSTVQRAYVSNNFTPLAFDEGSSSFLQLNGNYKKVLFNLDYNSGDQKTLGSGKSLEFEYKIFNFNTEYDFDLIEDLNTRVGLSGRYSIYNGLILGSFVQNPDFSYSDYLGDRNNNSISAFARFEYKLENLRLIMALRGDKYETPDKIFISPQFIAFYKINEDHNLRFNYSKAARSPFFLNLFTNFQIISTAGPTMKFIFNYLGNPEQKLLTSDQFEFGGRSQITNNFSLEYSTYYAIAKDFDILATTNRTITTAGGITTYDYRISYINIDAKAEQLGGTLSAIVVPTKYLIFKPYISYQQTKVTKYYDSLNIYGKAVDRKSDADDSPYIDFTHKATPNVYGGLIVNYNPIEELNVNFNGYFLGEQTMSVTGIKLTAKSQFIVNTTVSYEFLKNMKIFVTARNLGSTERQFAFTDKTSAFYGVGLDINY